jgi:hypothetical protein
MQPAPLHVDDVKTPKTPASERVGASENRGEGIVAVQRTGGGGPVFGSSSWMGSCTPLASWARAARPR